MIPRNTQTINEMMKNLTQYKVFYEALEKTGMLPLLSKTKKEFNDAIDNNHGRPGSSWSSTEFYVPAECNVRYTVFAEDSTIMAANGIRTFADLKAKCVEWYKDAENWYPLPDGEKVSTGDDYTYTYNVVNMFVRYHILKAGMGEDASKKARKFPINLDDVTTIALFNGYETIEVPCLPFDANEYEDVDAARNRDAE